MLLRGFPPGELQGRPPLRSLFPLARATVISLAADQCPCPPLTSPALHVLPLCPATGYNDEGALEMMRLYQTIHTDHEGGNVSAHATHLVRCHGLAAWLPGCLPVRTHSIGAAR